MAGVGFDREINMAALAYGLAQLQNGVILLS